MHACPKLRHLLSQSFLVGAQCCESAACKERRRVSTVLSALSSFFFED